MKKILKAFQVIVEQLKEGSFNKLELELILNMASGIKKATENVLNKIPKGE